MKKTIYSKQASFIAERIRFIRSKAGLTSRELSKALGKGHSFISNCEVGERRIDMVEFYWICKACGASPHEEALALMKAFDKI